MSNEVCANFSELVRKTIVALYSETGNLQSSEETLAICRLVGASEDCDKVKAAVVTLIGSIKNGRSIQDSVKEIIDDMARASHPEEI